MSKFFGCDYGVQKELSEDQTQARRLAVLEIMRPKPSAFSFLRIGGLGDGAYLVPNDLGDVQACFSPGVDNSKAFEDQLSTDHDITCHMCDYSSDKDKLKTGLIPGKQTFDKLWLEPHDGPDSITLESWVKKYYPSGSGNLLLQMDIEGAEYRNIINTDIETLRKFKLIVIEIHGLGDINSNQILNEIIYSFFTKIGSAFTSIHAHPNNCAGKFTVKGTGITIPDVIEITFVRSDALSGRGQSLQSREAALVPHPLDVINDPNEPPIVLDEYWCGGPRPIESKMKILEDEIAYQATRSHHVFDLVNRQIFGVFQSATSKNALNYKTLSDSESEAKEALASLQEVAFGRPFQLSTGFRKSDRVEPDHDDAFFHTGLRLNESITIDLQQTISLGAMVIVNRLNACYDRASILCVELSKSPSFGEIEERACGLTEHKYYINSPLEFTTGKKCHLLVELPSVRARFVRLSSPLYTWLHLSDIRIYSTRSQA